MCLLAVFFRMVEDAPVVVGANREEAYRRIGTPPQIVPGPCRIVAGLDPVAGGTWLGVNEFGVVVGVTNRAKSQPPSAPRSRGLLARELLACGSARAAADLAARELDQKRYDGCNVLCVDPNGLYVLQAGDWLRVRPLPSGLHVLTSSDVDDDHDARQGHASWWLSQRQYTTARPCVEALKELCGQTGNGAPPMCLRGEQRGTVSSSIIAVRQPLSRGIYLHAQGPPDRTAYVDHSQLLKEIGAGEGER